MLDICKFGCSCTIFICTRKHPENWSASSGAFNRFKTAENNATRTQKKLMKMVATGDKKKVHTLEEELFVNMRLLEYYSELSHLVKYEYYSWFWKEADRLKTEADLLKTEDN